MRRHRTILLVLLGAAALLPGCSFDVMDPGALAIDGFRLRLAVEPAVIERQETLVATLRIENLRDEPVEVVSSCAAVARITTFLDGRRVDLEGTVPGCRNAITRFTIPAMDARVETYEVRAVRTDGEPVERGTYVLRADLMILDSPRLEAVFRVE